MHDVPGIKRLIAGFEKNGTQKIAVQYELHNVPLTFLQKLFHIDPNHPDLSISHMIDSYDINQDQASALQPYVNGIIDLKKFDFQLTCCSKE